MGEALVCRAPFPLEAEALSAVNDGWMDDLFNSIAVISGRLEVDNDRLCAMEPRLRLRRFRLERESNSGPVDQ